MNVSVIIPAYNEAKVIEKTLTSLNFNWIKEIIVINDGSNDNTLELVKDFPVRLINFKKNCGKGKAVEAGIKVASCEIIAIVDADLGKSVREVSRLLKPIINESADIVIGIINIEGGGLGLLRWFAEVVVKIFSGQIMEAPLSGQRVFHRRILADIIPFSEGFGLEVGMNLDVFYNNWILKEVKCNFSHRVTGQSIQGYLHRFKQFIDIIRTAWDKRGYLWKRLNS